MLQAPTLELKALVEQELQQNPVLEEVAAHGDRIAPTKRRRPPTPDLAEPPRTHLKPLSKQSVEEPVDDFQAEFDQLVQLDQEWRDHFSQTNVSVRQSTEEEEKRQFMFDSLTAGTSLAQILMDQARESDLTDEQRAIAELIIGNIDDYGYLKATVEELAASTSLPAEKISEVLKVIHIFRSARRRRARFARMPACSNLNAPARQDSLEYRIVRDFMDALGKRRIPEIARGTGRDVDEVQAALGRIAPP